MEPEWLYPTHIERTKALMREAIALAKKGMPVDIDTVEEDLPRWFRFYLDNGGDPGQLTASSDAAINSPRVLWEQVRDCILEHKHPIERVLPLVTSNTARILKLEQKGVLEKGRMGDILMLEKGSLEIVHVLSNGVFMVRDGALVRQESFLDESNREIHLVGRKGQEQNS